MRRHLNLLVALLTILIAGTTTARAASFTYDVPAIAHTGVHEPAVAEAGPAQLSVVREGSLSHPVNARSTSTTPTRSLVATEAVDDLLVKPGVSNSKLSNIVDDFYKGTTNPARVGTGTTADAVRNEVLTGQATGGTFHTLKAEQYSSALRSVLKSGNLSESDRLIAQSLLDDLQNALGTTP